jgi:hypothetical protein
MGSVSMRDTARTPLASSVMVTGMDPEPRADATVSASSSSSEASLVQANAHLGPSTTRMETPDSSVERYFSTVSRLADYGCAARCST